MVQSNIMLGLVRLRMLRVGISKYWTCRLASRSSLSEASRAMPINAMSHFRFLFAYWQVVILPGSVCGFGWFCAKMGPMRRPVTAAILALTMSLGYGQPAGPAARARQFLDLLLGGKGCIWGGGRRV